MNHLDLYSGAGCFAIAAEYIWGAEYNLHSFVECEPFAQKWLKANWPGCKIHPDAETYEHDGTTIDILTGGPPCQPISVAGRQRGQADDRWQWPTMFRIIQEVEPRFIIFENVANLINFDSGILFDGILTDMESAGYETATFVLPACSQDAPHLRNRVFILGNSSSARHQTERNERTQQGCNAYSASQSNLAHTSTAGLSIRGMQRRVRGKTVESSEGENFTGDSQGNLADSKKTIGRQNEPQRKSEGRTTTGRDGESELADTGHTGTARWRGGPDKALFRGQGWLENMRHSSCWQDYEWITGHDGKQRRIKFGIRLLVNGYPNRNDLLRLFGNATVWPVVVPIMKAINATDKMVF